MLEGSDRTVVVRVLLQGPGPGSVVVKLHLGEGFPEAVVREPAALSLLHGRPGALRLLAVSTDPPGVVLGDLGAGGDLACALLGSDRAAAEAGVVAWATSLARLQRLTVHESAAFASALAEHADRLGRPVPVADPMAATLATAAEKLAGSLPRLGITATPEALAELHGLDALLGGDVRALTPADACPDNNLWTCDGLVLLDYEGAQYRHVAWDAAYLRVPWPSCWCAWALPVEVADRALAAWKTAFADPYVSTTGFARDLDVAVLGWTLLSLSIFLDRAVDGIPQTDEEAAVMPTRRTMLQHRLLHAPGDDRLPHLSALVREISAAACAAWDAPPLALAPAFR